MQIWLKSALVAISFALTTPASFADDWPQWLGRHRDSVWRETGIVREFPASGPNFKWRAKIAGGYAGPAVAGDRVYVTDYQTDGDQTPDPQKRNELEGSERVLCLSAADGSLIWKHEYDCPYAISYPAGPRVTPNVDEGCVYTLGAEGDLVCLDAESGKPVWSRKLTADYDTQTPLWGFAGHPLIDGDKLFCLVGGEGSVAVAFDKRTGKELWRALSAREPGYCPPTVIEAGGTRQLIIWHAQAVNSLDPETGEIYWSIELEPNFGMSIATPRLLGNYLFVGGVINKSVLLELDPNKPAAEVVWRGEKGVGIGPVNSTPFLTGDYMYGVDRQGELRCLKLATGEHLWSTYDATTGDRRANSATAFLVKNDDRFFLASETGDLIIAQLTPEGYHELSRCHILEPTGDAFGRGVVWSHPAFAHKCVFARNDKELVCVSLAAEE